MKKSEVQSYTDMATYLNEKNGEAKRLYHYTTYDSLLYILDGKSFRLSRTQLLNDKKEQEFCKKNDCFVLSMTGDKEYISMWSLYGKPSGIKIRIDFSKALFKKCFRIENVFSDAALRNNYFSESKLLFDAKTEENQKRCVLGSVTYIDKEKLHFKHNGNEFTNVPVTSEALQYMAGFVKYEAWDFEKEVRARILAKSNNTIDYVYIKLTDELLNDICVTFNPWMSNKIKSEITDSLAHRGIKCRESDYDGQISEL